MTIETRFGIGEIVHHKQFDYRGVVFDVDPYLMLSEEWYEKMAKSRPPKNEPWYHVLVHESNQTTYVAERNLEQDHDKSQISHPLVARFFEQYSEDHYIRKSLHTN